MYGFCHALGSILADIHMVELERTLLPTLEEHVSEWHRYVDDTIATVKNESIEHVNNVLNSFHPNIPIYARGRRK